MSVPKTTMPPILWKTMARVLRMISRLVSALTGSLPPERRKGYRRSVQRKRIPFSSSVAASCSPR